MALDTKQYLEELLKEAGVSDEVQKQAISGFFGNEKVSQRLAADVMRQSDYSRNMDALKAEKDKVAKETMDYYQKEIARKANDQKVLDQYAAAVKAYETQYGALDNTQVNHSVQENIFGKNEVEKLLTERLQQQTNSMITVMEWLGQKPIEHYKTFGEPMDVSAIKKLAVDKGYSLDQAYAEYSGPMMEARQKADVEKRIADAKAEGAREFASTHKLPIDAKPREYHPIFDRKVEQTPVTERERAQSFAETWNNAGSTSGG